MARSTLHAEPGSPSPRAAAAAGPNPDRSAAPRPGETVLTSPKGGEGSRAEVFGWTGFGQSHSARDSQFQWFSTLFDVFWLSDGFRSAMGIDQWMAIHGRPQCVVRSKNQRSHPMKVKGTETGCQRTPVCGTFGL